MLTTASANMPMLTYPPAASRYRSLFVMGGCASQPAKPAVDAEEEERRAQKIKEAEAASRKSRNLSIDGMMRKGSLHPDARMRLIQREEEVKAAEQKVLNKAQHYAWVAGGSVGSSKHHYSGDEFKGRRRKAADGDSTDDSSDDEEAVEHAKKALAKAAECKELIKRNREELMEEFPQMKDSPAYAEEIAEVERFYESVVAAVAKAEGKAAYVGKVGVDC